MKIKSHTLRGCVDWNMRLMAENVMPLKSHPTWVCGLKPWEDGEWENDEVTPYVGVWIETTVVSGASALEYSHTLRGCVDWNIIYSIPIPCWSGHTLRGCVDWNTDDDCIRYVKQGHTLRGCVDWNLKGLLIGKNGSGHTLRGCVDWNLQCHSKNGGSICHTLRGCVDWNRRSNGGIPYISVTPYVGVWIETLLKRHHINTAYRHTLRGCVDWNIPPHVVPLFIESHPTWVCGLKHHTQNGCLQAKVVTPYVGVWIETLSAKWLRLAILVTPYVGVWIETVCIWITSYLR